MKAARAWIERATTRIDAMSLRERALLFASLVAALAALADVLVLSPQMAAQRAVTRELQARNAELDALRARLAAAPALAETPQGRLQTALSAVHAERELVDGEVRRLQADAGSTARLHDLLARVLKRHERLALLKLDSAEPTPEAALADGGRGVDLRLRGAHADLVAYLREIERELPGLRWSDLHVDARQLPPVLAVRVTLPGGGA